MGSYPKLERLTMPRISRKHFLRISRQESVLASVGFNQEEAETLRRISMTLHRWAEHECNGSIQRDEETGIPYWYSLGTYQRIGRAPDREAGAIRRLNELMASHPDMRVYIQGDPRGCMVYVYRASEMNLRPGIDISSVYSSIGIAVGF